MQISFSSGGSKQSVLTALGHKRAELEETQPGALPVADAAIAHVSQALEGVGAEDTVSVSLSVSVSVAKPTPAQG
jgi:hypothetical protein